MDMPISDITSEAPARTTISSTISNNLVNNNNIELPYYRLSKSNQSCSICETYFSKKKKKSVGINEEIRAERLINHRIFIPEKSKCCATHICDAYQNGGVLKGRFPDNKNGIFGFSVVNYLRRR